MFNQYSYKTKLKVLAVLVCFLAITAYKRSYGSLLQLIRENGVLKEQSLKNNGANSIKQLNAELISLNRVLGSNSQDKEKTQQDIINFISKNGQLISIYSLESIHVFEDEEHRVYTYQVDVTGRLDELLTLSYEFEKQMTGAKLVSLTYYTAKKNNTSPVLHLKMTFQSYENI